MTSHPVFDDDDDYHESVSRHGLPEWETGPSRQQLPPMSGRMWTAPRAYSAFSVRSVTGPHRHRHRHRHETDPDRSRDSSSPYSCIHVVIIVVGIVSILSVLAAIFIATIGLNNLASET